MSRVPAIVYVAHLGQAKADAGSGWELAAITVAVLGGTSIRGGSGRVEGAVLALLCIGEPVELENVVGSSHLRRSFFVAL